MAYQFTIQLNDLVSKDLSKITNLTQKFSTLGQKNFIKYRNALRPAGNSIAGLEEKLQRLQYRQRKAFTIGNIIKYNLQIRKTERRLRRLRNLPPLSMFQRFKRMSSHLGGFLGLAGGIYTVTDSFRKMDQQMQAVAQVQQGIASTGGKAGFSLEQLKKKAQELQGKTIFGDEAILQNTTAQLLTFTNIIGKEFTRTQKAVLDVTSRIKGAKATSEDLRATSIMLGKALNDPVANLGQLGRSGIQFSDSQKELIKSYAQTNQLAKAQGMILEELNKQYGGSAEVMAKVGLGPLKQFRNSLGDLQEKFAEMILPALQKLVELLKPAVEWTRKHAETIGKLVVWLGGAFVAFKTFSFFLSVYRVAQMGVIAVTQIWRGVQMLFNVTLWGCPIVWIIAGIAALVVGIIACWNHFESFRGTIVAVWEVLKKFGEIILHFVINRFKEMLSGIMGIGSALMHFFKGEWKDAWKAGKQAAKDLMGVGTISQVYKEGKEIGSAWHKGYQKGVGAGKIKVPSFSQSPETAAPALSQTKIPKMKVSVQVPDFLRKASNKLAYPAPLLSNTKTTDNEAKKGINEINGGGRKQTNINVQFGKLIEQLTIQSETLTEGIDEMEDKVKDALLRILNSSNQLQTSS